MRVFAQLYMRAGCHLCEVAEADLRSLAQTLRTEPPQPSRLEKLLGGAGGRRSSRDAQWEPIELELQLVDIDQAGDAALLARYTDRVPVLAVGDREYAAPLSAELLEQALRSAANDEVEAQADERALAESADAASLPEPQVRRADPGHQNNADPTKPDAGLGHVGGASEIADHPDAARTVSSRGSGASANDVPKDGVPKVADTRDAAATSGDRP
jgi:hypothetical protein